MQKPLIVCGMDFSGTSMVAGMLHAAGIDMGDVESAEDVAQSDRPIRYRLFEDRWLQEICKWLARGIMEEPTNPGECIDMLFERFQRYCKGRNEQANGKRWGAKNNTLTFLTLHPRWKELPVEWVTTYRPLEDSMASAFRKLGHHPKVAAFLGVQAMAYEELCTGMETPPCINYDDLRYTPGKVASKLCRDFGLSLETHLAMTIIVDAKKGVIPWQPHGSPSPV